MMLTRIARGAMRRRSAVTSLAVLVLLANLLFAGYVQPPNVLDESLPMAASCQGGGPGCAEQPLLPPASIGLPRFETPPAPVFGTLVRIDLLLPDAPDDRPPLRIDHPPALSFA